MALEQEIINYSSLGWGGRGRGEEGEGQKKEKGREEPKRRKGEEERGKGRIIHHTSCAKPQTQRHAAPQLPRP